MHLLLNSSKEYDFPEGYHEPSESGMICPLLRFRLVDPLAAITSEEEQLLPPLPPWLAYNPILPEVRGLQSLLQLTDPPLLIP